MVPVPTFEKVTVPVPTFEKLRFRFHKAKSYGSYGSGSGSTMLYKRSLQLSKENIQHFKTLPSWIRIRIPNTNTEYGIRIRIRTH
jgi:hypothetical protein